MESVVISDKANKLTNWCSGNSRVDVSTTKVRNRQTNSTLSTQKVELCTDCTSVQCTVAKQAYL